MFELEEKDIVLGKYTVKIKELLPDGKDFLIYTVTERNKLMEKANAKEKKEANKTFCKMLRNSLVSIKKGNKTVKNFTDSDLEVFMSRVTGAGLTNLIYEMRHLGEIDLKGKKK